MNASLNGLLVGGGLCVTIVAVFFFGVRAGRRAPARGYPPMSDGSTRNGLAIVVLALSTTSILALAIYTLAVSEAGDRPDTAKFVFGAILPLLASWVGTVLAYYYSRENLTAATRSVTDLAQQITSTQRLASIPVTGKMLRRSAFVTLPPDKARPWSVATSQTLESVQMYLAERDVQRLPLFDEQDRLVAVIHLSEITKFRASAMTRAPAAQASGAQLTQGATGAPAAAPSQPTLADLLDDPRRRALFEGFAVIPITATLADAKAAMDALDKCEDVFVTSSGRRTDPVLGWVTDKDIESVARL
ncbi:CBS domain-containing protein [Sorangium sp. So ce341]|uniref:CBS domain-containing protein n=1 Tax=Sorangium sp. So ce341 TaxID=3133302 RepID=UPI003F5EEFD8